MIQAGQYGMFTVNPAGQPHIIVLSSVRYSPAFCMDVYSAWARLPKKGDDR